MRNPLILSFLGCLFFFSCQQEPLVINERNELAKVKVNEHGMLAFVNKEVFETELKKFDNMSAADLDKFIGELNFKNFYNDTLNGDEVVLDPVFAKLLNSNRSIQVGDTIVVMEKDFDILFNSNDIESYLEYINSDNKSKRNISPSAVVPVIRSQIDVIENSKLASINNFVPLGSSQMSFNGEYDFYTPEVIRADGDRTRIKFSFYEYKRTLGNYRFGLEVIGQAYKKGGIFGNRKWRDSKFDFVKYNLLHVTTDVGTPVLGPLYGIEAIRKEKVTIYNYEHPLSNAITLGTMSLDVYEMRKESTEPSSKSVSFTVTRNPSSGARTLFIDTSW